MTISRKMVHIPATFKWQSFLAWMQIDGGIRRWMMDQNKLIESVSSDFELHPNILESFRQKEEQLSKLNNNRDSEKLPTQLSFSENQTRLPEPPKESPQAVANLPNDSALLSSIKIPLI